MAELSRHAKPGSDWTSRDLKAYHITVRTQDVEKFFGRDPVVMKSDIDDVLFSGSIHNVESRTMFPDTRRVLNYMELASGSHADQASALVDFTRELLRSLTFEERGTLFRTNYAIPFSIHGKSRSAHTDVCLVQSKGLILVIVQTSPDILDEAAEPRAIAAAIAAFRSNNALRVNQREEQLEEMVIPCITMAGTRPTFYKVPVTMELSDAVARGEYPSGKTIVRKYAVLPETGHENVGMESTKYRKPALKHADAFQGVAKKMWSAYSLPFTYDVFYGPLRF